MNLPPDPGRAPLPVLISRFAGFDLRTRMRRTAVRMGLVKLLNAVPEDWRIPDSTLAKSAMALSREMCSEIVFNHSIRTYCFGAILAARTGLKLDREILFVSSALHDLGLTEAHKDDPGSFEWVGARLAHDFCLKRDTPAARADRIYEAIALHASPGIADRGAPEVAMIHFGAGMDLFGTRVEEVPEATLRELLERYPRTGFQGCFRECLQYQADTKPQSHIAGGMGVGLKGMIRENLLPA